MQCYTAEHFVTSQTKMTSASCTLNAFTYYQFLCSPSWCQCYLLLSKLLFSILIKKSVDIIVTFIMKHQQYYIT